MFSNHYKMKSKVWPYPGMAGWHFLTLPQKQSKEITTRFGAFKKGWGSLPVQVTIGKTVWRTSIFPDKRAGAYLLPLKASVRKKEDILADDVVTFVVEIQVPTNMSKNTKTLKICSRGHAYKTAPCPACWPGGQKRKKK